MNTCVDTTVLMIPGLFVLPEPVFQIRGSIFRPSFNKVAKKIDYKKTLEEW